MYIFWFVLNQPSETALYCFYFLLLHDIKHCHCPGFVIQCLMHLSNEKKREIVKDGQYDCCTRNTTHLNRAFRFNLKSTNCLIIIRVS